MPSKLNCKVAQEIIAGAVAAGQRNGLKPVAICILDPAGHEIATARMDGVLPAAFPKFAKAKAMTAIGTQKSRGSPFAIQKVPRTANG